jgi:hypothetical protein
MSVLLAGLLAVLTACEPCPDPKYDIWDYVADWDTMNVVTCQFAYCVDHVAFDVRPGPDGSSWAAWIK